MMDLEDQFNTRICELVAGMIEDGRILERAGPDDYHELVALLRRGYTARSVFAPPVKENGE